MKGYFGRHEQLGFPFPQELVVGIVLNLLSDSYHQFILNFNMENMERSLMELHGMLKIVEVSMVKPRSTSLTTPVSTFREDGVKKLLS